MYLTSQQFEALMPDASQLLSDEPEMESSLHYMQLLLLVTSLEWLWRDPSELGGANREDFFLGANLTIDFSREQLKNRDYRGPDFFLVKETDKRPRPSWTVWEEGGQYPNVIIELLSPSTETVDRGLKKALYQDRFRTPEYFWFGPYNLELQGFRLSESRHQAIAPNAQGWLWSQEFGLYLGLHDQRLRYFTEAGQLVPTPEEVAETQLQRAEAQTQRAEAEALRADQMADYLRSLGLDPEQLPPHHSPSNRT